MNRRRRSRSVNGERERAGGRSRRSAGLLALALSLGCSVETPEPVDGFRTRDSVGVRIVENLSPAWSQGQGWEVSGVPRVEIGVVEGPPEYQLFRASDAVRLSDGRIVVANAGTSELRFFDPDGRFLHAVGGGGEGPGEFGFVRDLWRLPGDSLLTFDPRTGRLSRFDPAGSFVEGVTLEGLRQPPFIEPVGRFPDGSLVGRSLGLPTGRGEPELGRIRVPVAYFRFSPTGSVVDTIARFAGSEVWVRHRPDGWVARPAPFGLDVKHAVRGDRLYAGETDALEIGGYSSHGELLTSIRKEYRPRPVTPELVARWSVDPEAPLPETVPAFSELRADPAGNLWVRRFGPSRELRGGVWDIFDRNGRWLGTVTMPAGLTVFEIGRNWVLGGSSDELDVERIRLHDLRKDARGSSR